MIAIQFEARKIGLIAEYKKTQEHRDREFELANKCIALVQQKDQIDEEIDQIDANIISQQERHASQQQSFIDDQKRKGKNPQSNHTLILKDSTQESGRESFRIVPTWINRLIR